MTPRPAPTAATRIAALAQTVAALIERNRKRPVHLIANSLGGAVCVRLAATRPDLVKTLTLISPALPDSRPRLDLVRFPVMSLPRLGPRLLRKYEALPPQARVADVITTCYADPARFPPARFNAEVTELARRDTLDYATDAMVGSIRALTAEAFRAGRHAAWRDAARITVPTLVIYGSHDRAGPAPDGGPGRAGVPRRPDRRAAAYRSRRAHGASRTGGRRDRRAAGGNSRPRRPVDRGTGGRASSHARSVKMKALEKPCRCPLWWSPPKR